MSSLTLTKMPEQPTPYTQLDTLFSTHPDASERVSYLTTLYSSSSSTTTSYHTFSERHVLPTAEQQQEAVTIADASSKFTHIVVQLFNAILSLNSPSPSDPALQRHAGRPLTSFQVEWLIEQLLKRAVFNDMLTGADKATCAAHCSELLLSRVSLTADDTNQQTVTELQRLRDAQAAAAADAAALAATGKKQKPSKAKPTDADDTISDPRALPIEVVFSHAQCKSVMDVLAEQIFARYALWLAVFEKKRLECGVPSEHSAACAGVASVPVTA